MPRHVVRSNCVCPAVPFVKRRHAAATAFLVSSTAACTAGGATTIHVPQDVPTIAAALARATSGTTVLLAPGVHPVDGPVTVPAGDITIRGEGDDPSAVLVVHGGPSLYAELVAAPGDGHVFTVADLTVRGLLAMTVQGGTLSIEGARLVGDPDTDLLMPVVVGMQSMVAVTATDLMLGESSWYGAGNGSALNAVGGALVLNDVHVDDVAGGIADTFGTLVSIGDSTFEDVFAFAGINVDGGSLSLVGVDLIGWGALHSIVTTDADVAFLDVTALGLAYPMHLGGPTVSIADSHFEACGSFDGSAGVALVDSPNLTLGHSTFLANGYIDVGASAVFAHGAGEVTDCSFIDNTSGSYGALWLNGDFAVWGSTFSSNESGDGAGALRAQGAALEVTGCAFVGNLAGDTLYAGDAVGGAIAAYGCDVLVDDCVFEANVSTPDSGGGGHGGAIGLVGATCHVADSVFLGNRAVGDGGAVWSDGGAVTLVRARCTHNMAGGYGGCLEVSAAPAALEASLVLGNVAQTGGGLSGNGSLVGARVCGNQPDDLLGRWSADASTVTGCAVVEVPADAPTIQAGIEAAPTDAIVLVAPGTYAEAIDLLGKPLLLVSAGGADSTVVDASGFDESACLAIAGESDSTVVDGLTFANGTVGHEIGPGLRVGGGACAIGGSPVFRHCRFTQCAAHRGGGAHATDSTVRFEHCEFANCKSSADGGAGEFVDGAVVLLHSRIEGNVAGARGGGVHLVGGAPALVECALLGNSAVLGGGGIARSAGALPPPVGSAQVIQCQIEGNGASVGGGVWVQSGNAALALVGSAVCGNTPEQIAGGYLDLGGNDVCSCPGDLDGSGIVDAIDLVVLLGGWGTCDTCQDLVGADLDANGLVDGTDLTSLLGVWGPCTP